MKRAVTSSVGKPDGIDCDDEEDCGSGDGSEYEDDFCMDESNLSSSHLSKLEVI